MSSNCLHTLISAARAFSHVLNDISTRSFASVSVRFDTVPLRFASDAARSDQNVYAAFHTEMFCQDLVYALVLPHYPSYILIHQMRHGPLALHV